MKSCSSLYVAYGGTSGVKNAQNSCYAFLLTLLERMHIRVHSTCCPKLNFLLLTMVHSISRNSIIIKVIGGQTGHTTVHDTNSIILAQPQQAHIKSNEVLSQSSTHEWLRNRPFNSEGES